MCDAVEELGVAVIFLLCPLHFTLEWTGFVELVLGLGVLDASGVVVEEARMEK